MSNNSKRTAPTLLLAWLLFSGTANAAAPYVVLYHEPLAAKSAASDQPDAEETLIFDAFGRRFEVLLRKNHKLSRHRSGAHYEFLKGRLANAPGSWVRLMRRGDELSGMIRDVYDVYVVEPRAEAVDGLLDPAASERSVNVIYRLADTVVSPGALNCGSDTHADTPGVMTSGQAAFDGLVTELGNVQTMLVLGALRRITLGAMGDYELFIDLGVQTEAAILNRFNIIDGIYMNEFGLEIVVDEVVVFESAIEQALAQIGTTIQASELLDDVREYRLGNQLNLGLTHLVTGRSLGGNTAGIAFIGTPGFRGACTDTGASLTEIHPNPAYSALLIAHEIGHNLGASHDENQLSSTGALCKPGENIMSAQINQNNTTFSQCSLDKMEPLIRAANCITDIPVVDLILSRPLEVPIGALSTVPVGGEFQLTYDVTNSGTGAGTNINTQLNIPATFSIVSLTLPGGSCTVPTGNCALASLGAGARATVLATLMANATGNFMVGQSVMVAADIDTTNNSQTVTVIAEMNPDLRVGISAASGILVGGSTSATITVDNNSATLATNVTVNLSAPGFDIDNMTSPTVGATCSPTSCMVASLSGQGSFQIDVELTGDTAGNKTLAAVATANPGEVVPADNMATLSIRVSPPNEGGGGALHWSFLLALIPVGMRRRRRLLH